MQACYKRMRNLCKHSDTVYVCVDIDLQMCRCYGERFVNDSIKIKLKMRRRIENDYGE